MLSPTQKGSNLQLQLANLAPFETPGTTGVLNALARVRRLPFPPSLSLALRFGIRIATQQNDLRRPKLIGLLLLCT